MQVVELSTIGGSTVKECTRRLLRHVMTDGCARFVNFKGRGGKVAFAELTLNSVINSTYNMLSPCYHHIL